MLWTDIIRQGMDWMSSDCVIVPTLLSTLFLFFHIISLPLHVWDTCPTGILRDLNRITGVDLLSGHDDVEIE